MLYQLSYPATEKVVSIYLNQGGLSIGRSDLFKKNSLRSIDRVNATVKKMHSAELGDVYWAVILI